MKTLEIVRAYFRGIRFQMLLLSIMMAFSLFLSVRAVSKYEYLRVGLDVVDSPRKNDLHYVFCFTTAGDKLQQGTIALFYNTKERMKTLSDISAVESVYTIWEANNLLELSSPEERKAAEQKVMDAILAGEEPELPKNTTTSVFFYEEEMLKDFPALKKLGIDLKSVGCLLGKDTFRNFEQDGQITLYSTTNEEVFKAYPVSGRLKHPYLTMSFGKSSTQQMDSSDFLRKEASIIFEYNEDNKYEFFASIVPNTNFMLKFRQDATEAERRAVLDGLGDVYYTQAVADIAEETERKMREKLWEELPKPMFMLLVSMVAFFSTVILTVKTKEKEAAVYYLCGASRRRCAALTVLTFVPVSLVPTVIGLIYTMIRPVLEWNGVLAVTENTLTSSITQSFLILYFFFTLVLSTVSVFAIMKKKSPVQLLKGGNQ